MINKFELLNEQTDKKVHSIHYRILIKFVVVVILLQKSNNCMLCLSYFVTGINKLAVMVSPQKNDEEFKTTKQ